MNDGPVVGSELVGDAWPAAQPGADPVLYGHVQLAPRGAFAVRSVQTFTLTYTVGRYGLDDTGSIRVVFRFMGDWGDLQTHDAAALNYVSARASSGARLALSYGRTAHQRPWFRALTVRLHGGYLREGDTIEVVFGDTSGGSPGMQMQTFVEPGFEFKVLADVCAVGHYVPLPETPHVAIVPGPPQVWRALLPSLRRPNEPFTLGIKAEDAWGNPTPLAAATLGLRASLPVDGLPPTFDYREGTRAHTFEALRVTTPGVLRIEVLDARGEVLAEAGPLVVREGRVAGFWGDMHGQSGESIGVTTARHYFEFARECAFLDACGHQANDFQINNAFWRHLDELTAEYHEDDRFVVLPGYEWSGNTAVGGDRNVYFRTQGRPIRRSSHALLEDRSDLHTDAPTAAALFDALADEDCVVYAHVGGRYADIAQAHDGRIETAMEIHSAWGTFEWLLTDGFALGHRAGVVCNSDGHKGRPGASYPGAAQFGAYGGLTCFLAESLTRDGLFECLRRRHHYGTTGCRLHLDVRVDFDADATLFERDPDVFDSPTAVRVRRAMMGDIVRTDAARVHLGFEVMAGAPIENVEVRNGHATLARLHPFERDAVGRRVRVLWSGAEYRGRGRQTTWRGRARFAGCRIRAFTKINAWNHERLLECRGADTVVFDAMTTGNFGGFDVWLDEDDDATLDISCNHGTLRCRLAELDLDGISLDAGGLERRLSAYRLPERIAERDFSASVEVPLDPTRDNPLWVCVTTEDGFKAWSSPIFVFRGSKAPES